MTRSEALKLELSELEPEYASLARSKHRYKEEYHKSEHTSEIEQASKRWHIAKRAMLEIEHKQELLRRELSSIEKGRRSKSASRSLGSAIIGHPWQRSTSVKPDRRYSAYSDSSDLSDRDRGRQRRPKSRRRSVSRQRSKSRRRQYEESDETPDLWGSSGLYTGIRDVVYVRTK